MNNYLHLKEVHRSAIVIDACAPILRDCDLADHWIKGGATCALATVALHDDTPASTIDAIGKLFQQINKRDDVVLSLSVDHIRTAKKSNRFAIVLMFQSSAALGGNLNMVDIYYRIGVRSMNLAYNQAELTADGCMEPRGGGLTKFGRQVIREMNRVGMVLDLSHTGYRATMEAMDISQYPVVFTHSNVKAVYDHPRNLEDDQIQRCAELRGVIGINGHPAFVRAGTVEPTIDDLISHLDYLVQKIGIDHVGIGLDFSTAPGIQMTRARYAKLMAEEVWSTATLPPPPWAYPVPDASKIEMITEVLVKKGWSDLDVNKVLGENFLRVFNEVWK